MKIQTSLREESMEQFLAGQVREGEVKYRWLGQAGFLFKGEKKSFILDGYLSDFLAKKYEGKKYPHQRMMPPPVSVAQLKTLDFVFCTHRHSDHMDPETIIGILKVNGQCEFVVPEAELSWVLELGVPMERIVPVNAGCRYLLSSGLVVDVIPSAHESFRQDELGRHHFLGYIIGLDGFKFYHSGDCIPYEGLEDTLKGLAPDIALLPINGRDRERSKNGIPGNFTLEEALQLAKNAEIDFLLGHHFGMFDFNTLDVEMAVARMSHERNDQEGLLARCDVSYCVVSISDSKK